MGFSSGVNGSGQVNGSGLVVNTSGMPGGMSVLDSILGPLSSLNGASSVPVVQPQFQAVPVNTGIQQADPSLVLFAAMASAFLSSQESSNSITPPPAQTIAEEVTTSAAENAIPEAVVDSDTDSIAAESDETSETTGDRESLPDNLPPGIRRRCENGGSLPPGLRRQYEHGHGHGRHSHGHDRPDHPQQSHCHRRD